MVSENLRAGNISYGMSAAALLKLTENCRVRKLLERADLRNMICFLSEEEFASPHNSNLLIKLFLNLFRISSVKVKYREELKKLKIIYPEEKNICDLEFKATICNLKDFLNNITEEESLSRRWENDEISENSVLEIEVDIDNDDPVVASVNGEEFLEKYYNIDFMKEREMLTDNSKNISKHLNVRLKQTGRSKSVPLMEDQGVEKSPSCHSLSGSTTPKLDPEATEMVRKIIGEHSKTLVEATAASHSSPVHIKGLNSKEYTLAFSSRPKIPRTPEPGELVVVTTQNFKIRRDSSRHTPVSPKVASSSPPNSTLQHLE
ncbi:uncharacterized protein LOC111625747 [Centruroides sculpturatus]|uniref:uncharacterized protein LOC111625747 n=1 Tax=Centruroides sculpturatus TaxID=218467 RepID=UPI000C6DFCFE|nr:uncharacterized protein LOC111625747 [Centruroides sculpturatus]XP_023224736.1 uncharacterized protein LOC111625747 [Centruroides sculpturatus]